MIIKTLILFIFITNGEAEIDYGKPRKSLDLDFNSPPMNQLNLTISLFEKPMIKNKLHELMNSFFSDNPLFDNDDELEDAWRSYILNQINESIEIPRSSKNDVSLLSLSLIRELIEFLQKIFINLENDKSFWYPSLDDYFEKIIWKKNGKIDEVKTYLNIFNGRDKTMKKVDSKYLFLEACKYCLEGSVTMSWLELSTATQEYIVKNILNGKFYDMPDSILSHQELETRHLLFYWRWIMGTYGSIVLRLKKPHSMAAVTDSNSELNIEEEARYLPVELEYGSGHDGFDLKSVRYTIQTSIETTNVVAVQYLIDAHYKNEELIQKIVKQAVTYWLSKRKEKQSIYYDDMLLFLLRQMESPAISSLYEKYRLEILDTLVESWPGKYLFLNVFAANYDITAEIYQSLFAHILQTIRKEYNLAGKKNLTSIWLLTEYLQKYSYFLKDDAISEAWSLPVLTEETKLIAIAFIATIPKIKKSNPLKYQRAIDKAFKFYGALFLTNKKYEALSDYIDYILSNEKKIEFIESLDIEGFYINLLEYTDDSELTQFFDFYNWLNAIGETKITTKIMKDAISSNKIFEERHNALYQAYILQS